RSASSTPMGFEQRPRSRHSEVDAGPPVALAPRAVLERRAQERVAEALAAVAASGSVAGTPPSPEVLDMLDRADKAVKEGNLTGNGNSAAALYAQALRAKSDSRRAANGLARVHVQLVMNIEQHLDEDELDEAADGIAALQKLPGTDEDVQRLRKNLESQRKVRPLLAHAATLLQQGNALKPEGPGNNALALYRQVLSIDPDNTVAAQGVENIQREVLDKALGAVASDDFKAADAALAQATRILPGSQALQDTRGRIEGIRQQRAASVLSQARTALDSGNVALAKDLKAKALSISPHVQGLDAFDQRLSNASLYAGFQSGQSFSDAFLDMRGRGPAMVVVPIGSFLMGSDNDAEGHQANESPQHEVQISHGFAIGRSEVTVGQFR